MSMDLLEILKVAGNLGIAGVFIVYLWLQNREKKDSNKFQMELAKMYNESQDKIAKTMSDNNDKMSVSFKELSQSFNGVSENFTFLRAVVEQNSITIREKLTKKKKVCKE